MGNFEKDLEINLYSLHTECKDFPNLYFKYAKKFANASEDKFTKEEQLKLFKAEAKLKIDQARANMDLEIRGNPEKFQKMFGIKKFTEASINSVIVTNPYFIQLQEDLAKQTEEKVNELAKTINDLEIYRAALVSLSHKKSGIADAIKLQIGGFYSELEESPPIKRGGTTLKERMEAKKHG